MKIDEIRDCPQFAPVVIDRIWQAWWRANGHPRTLIETAVHANLASTAVLPFCLVAQCDDVFLGTVSLIANDLGSRPMLTPWVAALWVEPDARKSGIATALLLACTQRALRVGGPVTYLQCAERLRPFYERRGWCLFEAAATAAGNCILQRHLAPPDLPGVAGWG